MIAKDLLRSVFLFETVPESDLAKIEEFSKERTCRKGEILFSDGDPASAFFALVQGQMRIYKLSPRGEEQVLHIHAPGDLIAEAAVFDRETYPAHCEALKDSRVVEIPKKEFIALILSRPTLALRILTAYSKRLRSFVAMIEDLTLRNTRERLAHHIWNNSTVKKTERICELNVSKTQLASMLGTIPETLSRALAHFKKEGILSERERTIVILKPDALKAYLS